MCILEADFHDNFLSGYDIRPLALEDAQLIIDAWNDTAFDYYSVAQVRFCIEHLPSLGKGFFL